MSSRIFHVCVRLCEKKRTKLRKSKPKEIKNFELKRDLILVTAVSG